MNLDVEEVNNLRRLELRRYQCHYRRWKSYAFRERFLRICFVPLAREKSICDMTLRRSANDTEIKDKAEPFMKLLNGRRKKWSAYLRWQRLLSRVALREWRDWCAQGYLRRVRCEDNAIAVHRDWTWLPFYARLVHLAFAWESQGWIQLGTWHPSRCINKHDEIEVNCRELEVLLEHSVNEMKNMRCSRVDVSLRRKMEIVSCWGLQEL